MSNVPIGSHALLSDCHSAALVTAAGSVDWLCWPRFDSPSVFGRLLDDTAGHWSIRPAGRFSADRRYLDRTLVLETSFHTPGGTVVVTDALAMGVDNYGHALGRRVPHLLIRSVTCVGGVVDVEVSYAPRPEYGLLHPLLSPADGGWTTRGGAERLVLSSPVPLTPHRHAATARVPMSAGQTVAFALHRATPEAEPARVWRPDEIAERLADTAAAWRSWSDLHQNYHGPWRDQVQHSGRVLRGLTFQPTGAGGGAAPPARPPPGGGERNWDYRYAWIRDASFTLQALWVAACPDEAGDFFAFMATATAATPGPDTPLQIMFGVGGEHDLTERVLPHLRGWRDSRPVRVGNGAWCQEQIDVYGEVLDAAYRLAGKIDLTDGDLRAFLVAAADGAAARWRQADQGIWEVRGEPRHFLYSKVMCWVALDRAIILADRLAAADRVPAWQRARDEIRRAVVRDGWSDAAGAFTQSFGSATLDASALMMPIVGFLPADDPRMRATIEAIADRLTDERGLVYRYRTSDGVDGLAGTEGTFLLCTFWLAQALAMAGCAARAREVFERAARYANDVGLLAEEIDPGSGEPLGNFPQAFSHIGLINAAWAISELRDGRATRP